MECVTNGSEGNLHECYFYVNYDIYTHKKTLKAASDNQSIPFHKEGKGQHQNNNTITYDLILWIPIYLMTQRQGIQFLLCKELIVP